LDFGFFFLIAFFLAFHFSAAVGFFLVMGSPYVVLLLVDNYHAFAWRRLTLGLIQNIYGRLRGDNRNIYADH